MKDVDSQGLELFAGDLVEITFDPAGDVKERLSCQRIFRVAKPNLWDEKAKRFGSVWLENIDAPIFTHKGFLKLICRGSLLDKINRVNSVTSPKMKVITSEICHVNGPGTTKELQLVVEQELEDENGKFTGMKQYTIPVPYSVPLADDIVTGWFAQFCFSP